MRLRVLAAAIFTFVCAPPAAAQVPESTTQMKLVTSVTFINRLIYNGVLVMKEVLEEPASASAQAPIPAYTTGCHTRRAQYAQNFLLSTDAYARQAANLVVSANFSGAVIVGTVIDRAETPGTDPPIWDTSATDGAIAQSVRILMNTFAGCVINAGS